MTESGGFSAADRGWMERAMELARRAEAEGEVPVGAVVANETGLLQAPTQRFSLYARRVSV
jgi:tRNA(Arg) A34 adenosine deaminase TadA